MKLHAPFPILILQHPQEQKKILQSVPLIEEVLDNCTVRVGMSWRNLEQAFSKKKEISTPLSPANWGVLYLGAKEEMLKLKNLIKNPPSSENYLFYFDKKKEPSLYKNSFQLEGLVLLDGNWKQAKTLWWRNAWLTRLKRLVLLRQTPSLFGNQKKEPRREALSTLEALAYTLLFFDDNKNISNTLIEKFKEVL